MGLRERAQKRTVRAEKDQVVQSDDYSSMISAQKETRSTWDSNPAVRVWESLCRVVGVSAKPVVCALALAALLTCRDAWVLALISGALANGVLSKVLKKIINQSRPENAQKDEPGMPSSHAMTLYFFASFLSITSQQVMGGGLMGSTAAPAGATGGAIAGATVMTVFPMLMSASWWRVAASLFIYVTLCCVYRVQCGLHTGPQVAVGAGLGTVSGAVWHSFCHNPVTSAVNYGLWMVQPEPVASGVSITELAATTSAIIPLPIIVLFVLMASAAVGAFRDLSDAFQVSKKWVEHRRNSFRS